MRRMAGIRRLWRFLREDIWRLDLGGLSRPRRAGVHVLRALVLAVHGAGTNRASVWAASLTYISLMSIIPFVALAAGLGARLGVPGKAVDALTGQIPPEQLKVLEEAAAAFEKADLKAIGVVAIVMLLYAMVKALTSIEKALNGVWGAERGRSFARRVSNYVSVAVVAPLLIFAAMATTAGLMSSRFMAAVRGLPVAGSLLDSALSAAPYVFAWLALTLLYFLMPNTRVRFTCAAAGAIVAGILWQVVQRLHFGAQREVAGLGVAYGAFAAVPMFLLWLYFSWMIVLLGAEIGYGLQHARTFALGRGFGEPSPGTKERSALRLALLLAENFTAGRGGLDTDEAAEALGIPERLARRLLDTLEHAGVAVALEGGGWQPARPPSAITAAEVVNAVRNAGAALPAPSGPGAPPEEGLTALAGRVDAALAVPLSDLLTRRG